MRSFRTIVVAVSIAAFMVSTSIPSFAQTQQERAHQEYLDQQEQLDQQSIKAIKQARKQAREDYIQKQQVQEQQARKEEFELQAEEARQMQAQVNRMQAQARLEQERANAARQQEQAREQEQGQAQQAQVQREADLGPKKLDESELQKCYQMQNDNNVRQCIEILQYPNPAVRQLRQTQLERAQQEYRATRAAQAREEEQEIYRMQQGQAQKRALPDIEYGR
jgi:hypothetical protein